MDGSYFCHLLLSNLSQTRWLISTSELQKQFDKVRILKESSQYTEILNKWHSRGQSSRTSGRDPNTANGINSQSTLCLIFFWEIHALMTYFWETCPYAPQNFCHCCVTSTGIVKRENHGNNRVGNSMHWRVLFVLSSSLPKLNFLSTYIYRYAEKLALEKRFTFRSLVE